MPNRLRLDRALRAPLRLHPRLRHCLFWLILFAGTSGAATLAFAQSGVAKYRGIHPLSPHQGRFCYIDLPHVHRIPPPDLRVYRVVADNQHVFVGDPVALGYDGLKFTYAGPHPLAMPNAPELAAAYCYIEKPHYHAHAPVETARAAFALKDDVYWTVAAPTPEFEKDRHNAWINQVQPIGGYQPPAVDKASAPPGHQPLVLPPAQAAPTAHAAPPGRGAPGNRPTGATRRKGRTP